MEDLRELNRPAHQAHVPLGAVAGGGACPECVAFFGVAPTSHCRSGCTKQERLAKKPRQVEVANTPDSMWSMGLKDPEYDDNVSQALTDSQAPGAQPFDSQF